MREAKKKDNSQVTVYLAVILFPGRKEATYEPTAR